MQILNTGPSRQATEMDIITETLPLNGARVLELGCGRAATTRRIAETFSVSRLIATEVDRRQHAKNLGISDLPDVEFLLGGAEAIDLGDASIDVVIMLKSLHHVPKDRMADALREITRVLAPGGLAYISEPVYTGDFNDILRLFNDEKNVRKAAFEAIRQAVNEGPLELAAEIFFDSPRQFDDWTDFENRMLRVTHTEHRIDAALYQRIKDTFCRHLGPGGAHFLIPSRLDLLRKPGQGSATGSAVNNYEH